MASGLQPDNWRDQTARVAWELDRAHSTIEDLSVTLDEGDELAAQQTLRLAQDAVTSVAHSVEQVQAPSSRPMLD